MRCRKIPNIVLGLYLSPCFGPRVYLMLSLVISLVCLFVCLSLTILESANQFFLKFSMKFEVIKVKNQQGWNFLINLIRGIKGDSVSKIVFLSFPKNRSLKHSSLHDVRAHSGASYDYGIISEKNLIQELRGIKCRKSGLLPFSQKLFLESF